MSDLPARDNKERRAVKEGGRKNPPQGEVCRHALLRLNLPCPPKSL